MPVSISRSTSKIFILYIDSRNKIVPSNLSALRRLNAT